MAKQQNAKVVLEIEPRSLAVWYLNTSGEIVEDERFAVRDGAPSIEPNPVARDAFNLLYQLLNDAVNADES